MTKTIAGNLSKRCPISRIKTLKHCLSYHSQLCYIVGSISTWHPQLGTIWPTDTTTLCHQHMHSRKNFLDNGLINEDVAFCLWNVIPLLLDNARLSQTQTNSLWNSLHMEIALRSISILLHQSGKIWSFTLITKGDSQRSKVCLDLKN